MNHLSRFVPAAFLAVLAACAAAPPQPVAFESGAVEFHAGDEIVVDEVLSSRGRIEPGALLTVRGRYRLASRDSGTLYLGTTVEGDGAVAGEGQTGSCIVARGEGTFELQHRVPAPCHPHVTFYDVGSGAPFGGRYFGNGPSLLLAKNWSYAR